MRAVGFWDFIGPTSLTKRRGWDALPAPATEVKAAPAVPYGRSIPTSDPLFGTIFYPTSSTAATSEPSCNSAVAACLSAIALAIAEPELALYRVENGERVEIGGTPLGLLLEQPNPAMSLDTLLQYVSNSLHCDGNAYWRKVRAGDPERGNVIQLWPIAPSRIAPYTASGSTDYITAYDYTSGSGRKERLSPGNVVHFRYGLDDDDHRLGAAPLTRLLAEISSDNQATRYADRLLANLAINGLSLEFDKEAPPINQATADEMKARVMAAYGGDNVGSVAVIAPGGKLTALGFSPEQMAMDTLHRVPEERIAAVLGVPAIVAGLGAGLERATYSNVREAREMFTEQKLLPLWAAIAATITQAFRDDFDLDGVIVAFDTSSVRALGEDQDALATRLKTLVEAGILDENEARAELGYAPRAAAPAALPAPAARAASGRTLRAVRSRKSIDDLPEMYREQRERAEPAWIETTTEFLDGQSVRVTQRLRGGAESADHLVPEIEAELLAEHLEPFQRAMLRAVSDMVAGELGVGFVVDDPLTRQFLADAGAHVVGITETTRAAVQAALIEGQAAGEGIEQLARRLRGLPAFGSARARVVARTELGHSQIEASYASYRASGVVSAVRILDGDYDAACAARDGTVLTLDQAASAPRLLHPNCTAAWAPITSDDARASA